MPKKPYPSQIAPTPPKRPKRPKQMGPDEGKVIKPYKGPRVNNSGPSSTGPKKQVPSSTRKQPVYEFKNGRFSKTTTPKMMGPTMPPAKAKRIAAPMMANPYDTRLNVKKGIGAMDQARNTQMTEAAALAQMAAKEAKMKKPAAPPTGIMGSTEKQRQDARNAALKQMDIQRRQKKYNG